MASLETVQMARISPVPGQLVGIKSGLFIWKASASPEPVFPLILILHCSQTGSIKDENLSCGQQAEGKKNSKYNSERVLDTHPTNPTRPDQLSVHSNAVPSARLTDYPGHYRLPLHQFVTRLWEREMAGGHTHGMVSWPLSKLWSWIFTFRYRKQPVPLCWSSWPD